MSNKIPPGRSLPANDSPGAAERAPHEPSAASRLGVRKTYKLYVGGAFPRSGAGRSYPVYSAKSGELLAFAARGLPEESSGARAGPGGGGGEVGGAAAVQPGQVPLPGPADSAGRPGAWRPQP